MGFNLIIYMKVSCLIDDLKGISLLNVLKLVLLIRSYKQVIL